MNRLNTYNDPNFAIKIALGQVFTISLESTPSSGYTWIVEYESKMIDLLKPKKFVPDSPGIGSSGQELFEFRAKKTGETQIKATYQRVWKKITLKESIFTISISQ